MVSNNQHKAKVVHCHMSSGCLYNLQHTHTNVGIRRSDFMIICTVQQKHVPVKEGCQMEGVRNSVVGLLSTMLYLVNTRTYCKQATG